MNDGHIKQEAHSLTGLTGFIGFKALLDALKAGFRVRCAVRSVERGNTLLSKLALQSLRYIPNNQEPTGEIVIVPDLAAPASPPRSTQANSELDAEAEFITPAKIATIEIRELSGGDNLTYGLCGSEPQDPKHPFTSSSRMSLMTLAFAYPRIVCMASKVASLEVLGLAALTGDEYQVLLTNSNKLVLNTIVQGINPTSPPPHMTRAIVDVRDVSRPHVDLLKQVNIVEAGGCRSFIALIPGAWEDILGITRRNFAEDLRSDSKRVVVLGEQRSIPIGIDASDTELAFEWKFTGFAQTITDLISHYIELR
ncbi:hypothetical protein PITC_013200 [Penicillium italicum]|uniref:Uncharacterized protein n=1 Tax=Penicillium italicum TaxID=40296 RepID=A0A0A2K7X7_PENIT|nr:hypothetical protein PITC_013200 [Penicillium italicum]